MSNYVDRLRTPEECEQFILNVEAEHPELARDAQRRAVQLRAQRHAATTAIEREAFEAIHAYEAVLSKRAGRKIRASRTWPMVEKYGIVEAMRRLVDRDDDPSGYRSLAEMNMADLTFEAVVLRHATVFSEGVVERCRRRLAEYQASMPTGEQPGTRHAASA